MLSILKRLPPDRRQFVAVGSSAVLPSLPLGGGNRGVSCTQGSSGSSLSPLFQPFSNNANKRRLAASAAKKDRFFYSTVKDRLVVLVPLAFVTATGPVVAPAGTVARIV